MNTEVILKIENLQKNFTSTKALDDVSLEIERGSICGLLGPNGAGKTTLLRIINGILVSDSGSVTVNGLPASLETSRFIGYMPEERGLYDKMRIEDQIMYFGQLKGGEPRRLRVVMEELLGKFGLADMKRRRIKELSKGNQQKVQIISTLVHEPELVILDEPFSGFDPINGAILQEVIADLHEKGVTIMLSSHNMPAIEEMCSDILLVNRGRLLMQGKITDIKERFKDDRLLLTTRKPLNIDFLMSSGTLRSVEPTNPKYGRTGSAYRLEKVKGVSNSAVLDAITTQAEVLHFEEELPALSDIFLKVVNS